MRRASTKAITSFERYIVLNLPADLLFVGGLACLGLLFVPISNVLIYGATALLAAALASLLMCWGWRVTLRLPGKVRIANTLLKRIACKGYQASYFKATCASPCLRLLTRLLHAKVGLTANCGAVIARYRTDGGFFIEHSNPEVEALLNAGHLRDDQICDAVRAHLSRT